MVNTAVQERALPKRAKHGGGKRGRVGGSTLQRSLKTRRPPSARHGSTASSHERRSTGRSLEMLSPRVSTPTKSSRLLWGDRESIGGTSGRYLLHLSFPYSPSRLRSLLTFLRNDLLTYFTYFYLFLLIYLRTDLRTHLARSARRTPATRVARLRRHVPKRRPTHGSSRARTIASWKRTQCTFSARAASMS